MSSPTSRGEDSGVRTRSASSAACESCRKLKMRCIRPRDQGRGGSSTEPCERCQRNNRACTIPEPRPLGRKRGAVGRYHGLEKAYRKMQSELKKAKPSRGIESTQETVDHLLTGDEPIADVLMLNESGRMSDENQSSDLVDKPSCPTMPPRQAHTAVQDTVQQPDFASPRAAFMHNDEANRSDQEPLSNPLALLADASGVAQTAEPGSTPMSASLGSNDESSAKRLAADFSARRNPSHHLLRRPGYVSLGLQLGRDTLEHGLDALFSSTERKYSDYFKPPIRAPFPDTGADVDPIDLGLVTMEEAYYLFPIYFARLHPINGILDPMLHTPDFVRSRSALLFTWILALTAQFDHASGSIAKRLQLHGEKLSKHVHTCGHKSVEIIQGYYISLLSATPAATLAEERSWLYTMYAFGLGAELGLDQQSYNGELGPSISQPGNPLYDKDPMMQQVASLSNNMTAQHVHDTTEEDPTYDQRLARNRQRTWLRILLWERANSAARGRIHSFPETELTRNVERWCLHPLADQTDKHTSAFITLRRILASAQSELQQQASFSHSDPHWVRDLVDTALQPWYNVWIASSEDDHSTSQPEQLSNTFLLYVYLHGRLWTLSFALHSSINYNRHQTSIRQDCFEAAVRCCEVAVRDLQTVGEPLYCMLAPTWAMISYSGVLALSLFPALCGTRIESEVELLALLSQMALQLERAGTTPPHRFGIAALLGHHLQMILRARATNLKDTTEAVRHPSCLPDNSSYGNSASTSMQEHDHGLDDPMVSGYDPFLTTAMVSTEGDLTGEGFADLFREMFGPGFGGVF